MADTLTPADTLRKLAKTTDAWDMGAEGACLAGADDANKDHECRRYPPTAAGFPGVGLGTWCGEHKARMDGEA